MGVAKPRIDKFFQSRCLEIGDSFLMPLPVEFDRYQFSAGFRKRPRDPYPRVAGGCPDFQGVLIAVLHDDIVKSAAVHLGNVQIPPRTLAIV